MSIVAVPLRWCGTVVAPWAPSGRLFVRAAALLPKSHMTSFSVCTKCRTSLFNNTKVSFVQGLGRLLLSTKNLKAYTRDRFIHRAFSSTGGRRAKQSGRSWEVDSAVKTDTVVYSYKNERFFKMITVFGIVQLFFWGNLALFSYSGLSNVDEQALQGKIDRESFWGKILGYQVKYKYRLAVFCMTVGYIVMLFTWMYPQRSIQKLTLLAGGQNLRVTTYTHLGRTRSFVIPLANMSSEQTRSIKQPIMSLKIKGHWFYFLLDKNRGTFHELSLFDNVVNLKRKLK